MFETLKSKKLSVVGLIPARFGSKRVATKNIRDMQGHPLLAYSIRAAIDSGVFDSVVVSTDSERIADIARFYGAEVPFLRPAHLAADLSTDIEWVTYILNSFDSLKRSYDCFSILRPTSPFRKPATIQRAWQQFLNCQPADSLRAVEKCSQHPAKMWIMDGQYMLPLQKGSTNGVPLHSTPYQGLPLVYVQNASLEIAWTRVVGETGTISGTKIIPFLTESYEGFDINDPLDWELAEVLIKRDAHILPHVEAKAWK